MSAWTSWEIVSHRVSICGRTADTEGKPMPGVQIGVSAESKQSQKPGMPTGRAQARRGATDAPDAPRPCGEPGQTESRADGIFFFLDCPDGKYTVRAVDASSGAKAEKSATPATVAGGARKKRTKDQAPLEGYGIELVLKQ
jgi:hypothetical protein